MQNSGLGDIRNIKLSYSKTLEDLMFMSPEDRLKEINNFQPSLKLIHDIKHTIAGDTDDMILNVILRHIPLLINNGDINNDILFVHNFYERFKKEEEINVRKHMSISLSDLFEQRLIYLKSIDAKKYYGTGMITDKELNFYRELVDIFNRDKKTIVTLIRIYPSLIQAIEDPDLSKIIYSEVLADIIKDNIDPLLVIRILISFLTHLENISEKPEDVDWFILNECTFYIKRVVYSINTIHELHPFISHCHNAFKKSNSASFKKMYIKIFEILREIVKDAIGNDFKNKYKDITSISIVELIDRIQLLHSITNSAVGTVSNKAILTYMNTLGEIINNYNNLFADSDIMRGSLSSANNEYATVLLNLCVEEGTITNRYKHIVDYMNYSAALIKDVEPELLKFVNRTLITLAKHFEAGRFYVIDKLESKGIPVTNMMCGGFTFTDKSSASYNDLLNEKTRRIRAVYPNIKDILNVIIDARYSMSAKDMMRELVIVADIVGRGYDGDYVNKIFEESILNYNKDNFMDRLSRTLFGFSTAKLDLSKLYNIEYANKLLSSKAQVVNYKNIVRELDLDTFYRLSEIKISDNIGVAVEDDTPLFIEDLDFSDYDFGDSILLDEVDIFDLSVFQVLRQITANNLNLLTTNLAEEHDLYLSIVQMMEDVLG